MDDDKLGGLERRESHQDVYDPVVLIGGRCRFAVALDEVGLLRSCALERSLGEQRLHKRANVESNLRPERSIVRLEDNPLRAAVKAHLKKQRQPADGDVLPL